MEWYFICSPSDSFVLCFCGRDGAHLNSIPIILITLINKNVASASKQHKLQDRCFYLWCDQNIFINRLSPFQSLDLQFIRLLLLWACHLAQVSCSTSFISQNYFLANEEKWNRQISVGPSQKLKRVIYKLRNLQRSANYHRLLSLSLCFFKQSWVINHANWPGEYEILRTQKRRFSQITFILIWHWVSTLQF